MEFVYLIGCFAVLASSVIYGAPPPQGKQWALLVASSNSWYNYRHQADVCHAYHVLRSNGIPADRIVTMMYDDIANNDQNPHKGAIYNRPGGPNVYEGCVLDYTKTDVNVKNVFSVLSGDKQSVKGHGTGRVIESGPNDHIFVNIVDHGTEGALCFPNDEYMYADQLNQVLKNMKKNKQFSKMVIYVEACESGSVFDNIIDDRSDIFVSTAAAPTESSYAYYCETDIGCLGDLYSVVWMEQMDMLRTSWSDRFVSLFKQYKHVRTAVNKSHVELYGDFRLGFDRLSKYMGDTGNAKRPQLNEDLPNSQVPIADSKPVPSRDVRLYMLQSKLDKVNSGPERDSVMREIQEVEQNRRLVDETVDRVMANVAGEDMQLFEDLTTTRQPLREDQFECYRSVVDKFNAECFNTHQNPYVLKHFFKLANICSLQQVEHFASALHVGCPTTLRALNGVH